MSKRTLGITRDCLCSILSTRVDGRFNLHRSLKDEGAQPASRESGLEFQCFMHEALNQKVCLYLPLDVSFNTTTHTK